MVLTSAVLPGFEAIFMAMKLLEQIAQSSAELTAIRQDIHAHPELGFEELRTAALVAQLLRAWGVDEVHTGIAKTGVVGLIKGRQPDNGRFVGLRADMDALPMQEFNEFAHASKIPGKMHACGHDGHTTMLLGAAQYLAQHRDFAGTIALVFQPAEEFGAGGRVMIEDGLLERFPMQAIFGMHNMPGIEAGTFALSSGPVLASNSEFKLVIHGKGGHAAMPHLAVDPIVVATQVIQGFQTIISRNTKPMDAAVVSVTTLHAGETFNVIPDACELGGTVRAYTKEALDLIEQRMREIAQLTCQTYGATVEFRFNRIYPSTINHATETAFARSVLTQLVGPERLQPQAPIMAAEDFAFMLERIPGCYAFLGNGDGSHRAQGHGAGPCLVHNGSYDFNDAILPIGASYLAQVALSWLAQPATM